jgi:hypothetical protein
MSAGVCRMNTATLEFADRVRSILARGKRPAWWWNRVHAMRGANLSRVPSQAAIAHAFYYSTDERGVNWTFVLKGLGVGWN